MIRKYIERDIEVVLKLLNKKYIGYPVIFIMAVGSGFFLLWAIFNMFPGSAWEDYLVSVFMCIGQICLLAELYKLYKRIRNGE